MAKAIDTVYRGYKFRSRLEARWAVCLDVWGTKWEYEKEGYDLPSGWYLPDFWLPLPNKVCGVPAGYWLEIKPDSPNWEERRRLLELTFATGHNAYIFYGSSLGLDTTKVLKACRARNPKSLEGLALASHRDDDSPLIASRDESEGSVMLNVSYDDFPIAAFANFMTATNDIEKGLLAGRQARFEHEGFHNLRT